MKISIPAAFVATALLFAGGAAAQSRVADSQDSVWSGSPGNTQWLLFEEQVIVTNDVTRESAEATSQIVAAGGMHTLPGERCLFCGTDAAGNGRVELWQFRGTNRLVLQQSRVDAGRNFTGVAVAGGAVYLLDAAAGALLSGGWDGARALAGVGLSVVADATTPNFPKAGDCTLTTLGDGSVAVVPLPVGGGVRVVPGIVGRARLVPLAGSRGHDAYAVPARASHGDVTLPVVALTDTVFEIVRIGSGVIGVGVGTGIDTEVSVVLSEPLVVGEQYVARVVGQPTPTEYAFECVRRYGPSEALSKGARRRPFFCLAGAPSGSALHVRLAMERPRRASATECVDLLVGFRFGGEPVLPLPGGRSLLGASSSLPLSGWVAAKATQGGITASVPIPAGIADFVCLVQGVIRDGDRLRCSAIYGAEIR